MYRSLQCVEDGPGCLRLEAGLGEVERRRKAVRRVLCVGAREELGTLVDVVVGVDGDVLGAFACDDVGDPVGVTAWCGVDGCVRAVYLL